MEQLSIEDQRCEEEGILRPLAWAHGLEQGTEHDSILHDTRRICMNELPIYHDARDRYPETTRFNSAVKEKEGREKSKEIFIASKACFRNILC